ncbi:MAG: ABC transporter permease [Anaerolineae bacterium]|jgi:ABC-2 type transport system permease protein
MKSAIIKAFAFLAKEFHDVRRQPRLLLSLVGGPLLVLAAFGATFQTANPFISTVLVWPEDGVPGIDQAQAEQFIGRNFYLTKVTSDREEALAMLDEGRVDVVQIIPDVTQEEAIAQERPQIEVYSRTVDPNLEGWVRSLAYGEMNFINRQLLAREAQVAQDKAREIDVSLEDAASQFRLLQENFDAEQIERAETQARELRLALVGFVDFLPPISQAQANLAPELTRIHRDTEILIDDLGEFEQVLASGEVATRMERLASTVDEIEALHGTVGEFVGVPPENIVSPVQETYRNLRGTPYTMVIFYTPAVLALLVQQLAITLGSLGLVRERQMGSYEMFRVSPLRFSQILLGKSVAYVLYVTVAGVILTGLLALLKVPLPVHWVQHLVLLILLATASTGIGFLISALSQTDSQAIQLTMLLLLLSIFFTGFFLPLSGFSWPAWIVGALLPMTHALEGFQDLLLKGDSVTPGIMTVLVFISLLAYGLVLVIMRRQYRRMAH